MREDEWYILDPRAICDYLAKDVGILRHYVNSEKSNGTMFRRHAVWPQGADAVIEASCDVREWGCEAQNRVIREGRRNGRILR